MFDTSMLYNVLAGDIVVAQIPFEFLEWAKRIFPVTLGYRFERAA